MNWLLFVVCILCCYRLSHMLAGELGPANIFKRMRGKTSPKTNIGKGVRCPLCWSVWVSFAMTAHLAGFDFIKPTEIALYAFGITGGAVLLHKLDGKD